LINFSCQKSRQNDGFTSGRKIAEALQLNNSPTFFYIYKDFVKNEEFILKGNDVWNFGISFHLKGYERKVFLDFREVFDFYGRYNRVYTYLQGRGVHSIEGTIKELELLPFHESFVNLFLTDFLDYLAADKKQISLPEKQLNDFAELYKVKISSSKSNEEIKKSFTDTAELIQNFNSSIKKILSQKSRPKELEQLVNILSLDGNKSDKSEQITAKKQTFSYLYLYKILDELFEITINGSAFENFLLWKPLFEILGYIGYGDLTSARYDLLKLANISEKFEKLFDEAIKDSKSVKAKTGTGGKKSDNKSQDKTDSKYFKPVIELLFEDKSFKDFIHLHEYDSAEYFNKERFEEAIKWLSLFYILDKFETEIKTLKPLSVNKSLKERLTKFVLSYNLLLETSQKSGYRKDKLFELLK
jgi:hypothetical protein